jgi:serine/threonine-protein kinase
MEQKILLNNRYELLELLGSGGMAQVYKSKDLMLERLVAIKILKPEYSTNPMVQVRFRQEAKAIANLSHPNIVTVHDFGFDQKQLFIVMEYLSGQNLKQLIKKNGYYDPGDALPTMIQICAGLGYAHRAGIVHCDVKPHNVIVTSDHRVKVTDFGIARAISGINPDEQNEVIWGSPLYFSPEQAGGKAPSPASDVYSAGVVFYEMLTGRPPFVAKTAESLARLHREAVPGDPALVNEKISPQLNQVILKVLAKEPSSRYRTADQFGKVLTAVYEQEFIQGNIEDPIRNSKSQIQPSAGGKVHPSSEPEAKSVDWATLALTLFALLAVGGLFPLWLAIILKWVNIIYR